MHHTQTLSATPVALTPMYLCVRKWIQKLKTLKLTTTIRSSSTTMKTCSTLDLSTLFNFDISLLQIPDILALNQINNLFQRNKESGYTIGNGLNQTTINISCLLICQPRCQFVTRSVNVDFTIKSEFSHLLRQTQSSGIHVWLLYSGSGQEKAFILFLCIIEF